MAEQNFCVKFGKMAEQNFYVKFVDAPYLEGFLNEINERGYTLHSVVFAKGSFAVIYYRFTLSDAVMRELNYMEA